MRRLVLLLTLITLALPTACLDDGSWGEDDTTVDSDAPGSDGEAALTAGTILVEEHECFVAVTRSEDLAVFTFQFNCDPASVGIEIGGIVVGISDGGYLRRIEEIIDQTETAIVVRTSQAAIADAVVNASMSEVIDLDNGAREPLDFSGWTVFSGDVGPAHVGVGISEGLISLDSQLTLEAAFMNPGLEEFQARVDLDMSADLSFWVTSTNGLHWDQSITLWKVAYPFFTMVGPLPVVGHVEVALVAGVWVQAPGGFETTLGGEGTASLSAGGWYSQEVGWTSINERSFELTFDDPEFGILTDFMVRPYISVQPSVMMYSVAGPTFVAETYLSGLVTGTCSGVDWHLMGGVGARAGLKINLFDRFSPSKTWPIWSYEVPLVQGYIPWDFDVPEVCGNTNLICDETVSYNTGYPGSGGENSSYSCTEFPLTGSEYIYRFRQSGAMPQEVYLGLESDPDVQVLVIEDQGWLGAGPFDGDSCIAASTSATSFTALPDTDYWVIVDGEIPGGADYELSIGCGAPPEMTESCGDGVDDDWDGQIDCDDTDCLGSLECQPSGGVCIATELIACGQTLSGDTTLNPDASNGLDGYECNVGDYSGPEAIFLWLADVTGPVEFRLVDAQPMLVDHDLIVMDGTGTGCDTSSCVGHNFNSATFEAIAGHLYYLVVDGFNGAEGPYSVALDCAP